MATQADQAMALAARLRKQRKTLGINMTAAAEAAGMSRATWHRLERGETGVAWGMLLAAADVLGMDLRLVGPEEGRNRNATPVDALPLQIRLADFPGLRSLAWQIGEGVDVLTPREALGLYERNARHLDEDSLLPDEVSLLGKLRAVFDGGGR